MDMLLIGSFTNLAAVDEAGLRWVTGRLFLDDLALAEGPGARIYVRGSVDPSGPVSLTIDPLRGDVIEGPRYTDVAHPDGYPGWRRPEI